jgi:TonB family protein
MRMHAQAVHGIRKETAMSKGFLGQCIGMVLVGHVSLATATHTGLLSAHMPRLLTPEQQLRQEVSGYAAEIRSSILRDQRYPAEALANAWEGTTQIALVIGVDGRLKAVRMVTSSGHAVLDAEAITKARAATALPSPPRFLRGREFTVSLPVVFRMAD